MKHASGLRLFLLGLLATASPAFAGPGAVVELFTSQGCSSCPPADAILAEVARRPDVIALTLPVDYWDYLGWKDTLAQPAFTARQRAYAGGRADRQVFTPQIIVNGVGSCVGSDREKLQRLIAKHQAPGGDPAGGLPVPVALAQEGGTIRVTVGERDGPARQAEVWLLPVARELKVQIGRGENRGRTATYANVVRGMHRLGVWTGAGARFEARLEDVKAGGADGYVVLLQAVEEGRPGAILGAAMGGGA